MKPDVKLDVKSLDVKTTHLSSEDKLKEQNHIRQLAYKVRKKMPKDFPTFCKVAEHLIKNAYRYNKSDDDFQEHLVDVKEEEKLEVKPTSLRHDKGKQTSDAVTVGLCKDVNKQLREIRTLKRHNRIREQQEMVSKLKKEIETYRDISQTAGIALKTIHDWCSVPKERKHKATTMSELKRQEFSNFLMQDTITYCHAGKKYAGKQFLIHTWEEVHRRYLEQPEYHKHGTIGKSTMRSYKPKSVMLCGQTPVNQCLCDYCENFELMIHALLSVGLKNVAANKNKCMESTFCELREGQFGTNYRFAAKDCIR